MTGHLSTSRDALGPADVDDDVLVAMAATRLGRGGEALTLLASGAAVVPYDIPSITTGGRWWVDATLAGVDGHHHHVRWFVKVVQSFARAPEFQLVPEAVRPMADASVPWRTEPLVYRSDLRARLPIGLTMPRADAVIDLDEQSTAIWMEAVPATSIAWDDDHLVDAARRLGRLAGDRAVGELAAIGDPDGRFGAATYRDSRLRMQVIPMLRDDGIWRHPLLAATFDPALRDRLVEAADRTDGYVDELTSGPQGTAHGDACPNNLLTVAGDDDIVLVDFGFWSRQPLGFDLGQLVVGDVQLGRRASDTLAALDPRVVDAYRAGLADEGVIIERDVLDRLHAVQLLVYTALSAPPVELLDREPDDETFRLATERAGLARFIIDRVDATA